MGVYPCVRPFVGERKHEFLCLTVRRTVRMPVCVCVRVCMVVLGRTQR